MNKAAPLERQQLKLRATTRKALRRYANSERLTMSQAADRLIVAMIRVLKARGETS